MWQNINKQGKLFKANLIEEEANTMEELIATITENHSKQIKSLIKSTTEAMKAMLTLIKNKNKYSNGQSNDEKKKKQEEKSKCYKDAPGCKHCGKKHPYKKEDECWELEKNKDSHPSNWKYAKDT